MQIAIIGQTNQYGVVKRGALISSTEMIRAVTKMDCFSSFLGMGEGLAIVTRGALVLL